MSYDAKYSNQASKFLRKLNKDTTKRILDKVNELKENPYPSVSSKVKGTDYDKVRVGRFRIIYDVDNESKILGIVKIDKRSRVYD
ncbi:addiction module toxin RelE [Candidatus Pacearchaeota archaeon]|nr:addiction module toxin RelE [Candidatus Pacearchaeota archaeon]|tara:strand:+ start:619 stop:873 length:255 start_codon:yes stop_codon:yes gene_type:complete